MKNIEKWYVRLIDLADVGGIAVRYGKPVSCYGPENCDHCQFDKRHSECLTELIKWLNAEYEESKEVDWSKVPIGTKVLVSDDKLEWRKAYFYSCLNNIPYPFYVTSRFEPDEWSDVDESAVPYAFCKLAEDK